MDYIDRGFLRSNGKSVPPLGLEELIKRMQQTVKKTENAITRISRGFNSLKAFMFLIFCSRDLEDFNENIDRGDFAEKWYGLK